MSEIRRPSARRSQAGYAAVALAVLFLPSCFLAETEVVRDLRASWSPDGSSLLVVTSSYTTTDPSAPYHYDPSAFDYRIRLSTVDAADLELLSLEDVPRAKIAEIKEGKGSGGLAQYSPSYWMPDAPSGPLVVFGGRDGYGYLVGERRRVGYGAARAAHEAALGPEDAWIAQYLERVDIVPSPDGSVVAVLWYAFYFLVDEFGPIAHIRVLSYHDAATGAHLRSVQPTPSPWHFLRGMDPYAPLDTEAGSYAYTAWKADGSGVYVILPGDENGDEPLPDGGYAIEEDKVVFVPLAEAPPHAVSEVPPRPVQTSSGAVRADGSAVVMELRSGNRTRLSIVPFPASADPPWAAYGDGGAPAVLPTVWTTMF